MWYDGLWLLFVNLFQRSRWRFLGSMFRSSSTAFNLRQIANFTRCLWPICQATCIIWHGSIDMEWWSQFLMWAVNCLFIGVERYFVAELLESPHTYSKWNIAKKNETATSPTCVATMLEINIATLSGKTCLLIVFSKDQFPDVYVPTVFENYVADIEVDGKQVFLFYNVLFIQVPFAVSFITSNAKF